MKTRQRLGGPIVIRLTAAIFLAAAITAPPLLAAPVVLYGPGLSGATPAERVREFLGDSEFTSACIARGAKTGDIYDLFFIGGLAAGFEGNEDEARDWFAAAAAISPSKEWPSRYPPTLRPLSSKASRRLSGAPPPT
jgi:hypothetical protein